MNANEKEQGRPTGILRRHAKAIIVFIVAVAFLLPTALVLADSMQGQSAESDGGYSRTDAGSDATITDFTKLTRDERRQIIKGSPGANLTDAQKKEFIDTGMITSASPQDGTHAPKGTAKQGTSGQ